MSESAELPAILAAEAENQWQALLQADPAARAQLEALAGDAAWYARLGTLLATSPFAARLLCRAPGWLLQLQAAGDLDRSFAAADYRARLQPLLAAVDDADALARALRIFRNQQYLRLLWRDFNRLATMQQTTAELSALADLCIDAALDWHHRQLVSECGEPRAADGAPQRLVVIGMGKLGAGELNLSSDVDLMFTYPQAGETDGARPLSNQEFFIRLGQRLIKALDPVTADGFVFRVDMRLRPYGGAGPLVISFDAMEDYYQEQGRDWERYAMVKARAVAGDLAQGARLLEALRPFTYRRYIDFSVIESLRAMKQMIQREVARRRLQDNIKLGPGGIREIEFIAQCFQLIRGGRDRVLQEPNLRKVLRTLVDLGSLPEAAVAELIEAYRFLRDTEHAIQGFQDKQTQELPQAEYPRAALAWLLVRGDWAAFSAALAWHRERVSAHFGNVIASPDDAEEHPGAEATAVWRELWGRELWSDAPEQPLAVLAQAGHEDAEEVWRRLEALREGPLLQRMQSLGRERLERFMPLLLEAVTRAEQPSATLLRILPLVEAVLRRTAYLVLLEENPGALRQLVVLCEASPWIARELATHPVLLDELLDPRTLYHAPDKAELQADLRQQALRLDWEDLEAQMETLRYFKLAHVLRVAASEVTGRLPLMKVSDYLTWIAEVILEHVLAVAWNNLVKRHGRPLRADGKPCDPDFIIVGYGKLGGIELGHGSDLDLVFIHDGATDGATDGERELDNSVFFTRLGQRIIHILTTQTPLGSLYEVDMRLRPSGASGLLVSSLKAFTDYQEKEAWTWEHQALVRARSVAGDVELARRFDAVRSAVLCRPRDAAALREDVIGMRDRMREHLRPRDTETGDAPWLDLKQGSGAIVDIEFMVQYAVLAWSGEYPSLARYTDNIRILESLEQAGLLPADEAGALIQAYKDYRGRAHRLSLQHQPGRAPLAEFETQRAVVRACWQRLLGAPGD